MLAQRTLQYVEAAVAFGGSRFYVIFKAVLPNVLGPLAVQTAFTIANAVLLEAGLSFLGLGIQPPTPSLGLMLQEARGYLRADAWFGICPGVLIADRARAERGGGRDRPPRRSAQRRAHHPAKRQYEAMKITQRSRSQPRRRMPLPADFPSGLGARAQPDQHHHGADRGGDRRRHHRGRRGACGTGSGDLHRTVRGTVFHRAGSDADRVAGWHFARCGDSRAAALLHGNPAVGHRRQARGATGRTSCGAAIRSRDRLLRDRRGAGRRKRAWRMCGACWPRGIAR